MLKVKETLDPLAVALAESVTCVGETTAAMVVPAAMPVPLTRMPAANPLTAVANVTVVLPFVVVAFATVCEVTIALAESVSAVPESMEAMTALAGIPAPVTVIPARRPSVDVRFVIELLPSVVVPVRLTVGTNVKETLVAVAVALVESVMAVEEVILTMTVLAGMPDPVTAMPTSRPSVEKRFVMELLPLVVFPSLIFGAEKVTVGADV